MITTTTYRGRVEARRDLLAAFSALDHPTTERMAGAELDAAYQRLVARIMALLFLHDPSAPAAYAAALATEAVEPVAVTAGFLETGRAEPVEVSELQQELVHFSRIVDLAMADRKRQSGGKGGGRAAGGGAMAVDAELGQIDPDAARAAARLRASMRLPVGLKTLSELVIVARSRLLSRGVPVALPYLRAGNPPRRDLDDRSAAWEGEDFALLTVSPRRRTRNEAGFLITSLLEYLTPLEAAAVVWAHTFEAAPRAWLDVVITDVSPAGSVTGMAWSFPYPHDPRAEQHGGRAANAEPWGERLARMQVATPDRPVHQQAPHGAAIRVKSPGVAVRAAPTVLATLTDATGHTHHVKLHGHRADGETEGAGGAALVTRMAAEAERLLTGYQGPAVASIECGHIHLDRDLDIDQEVGAVLGQRARSVLQRRFGGAPALTPMMDDDHVLVKLRPGQYHTFLASVFTDTPMHLVAESSPIVRSIVTAMWQRVTDLGLDDRLRERGTNLFLRIGDGGDFCELFERYRDPDGQPGPAETGCVFFEAALLTYRCAPARFDRYFADRFGVDVHTEIARILDNAPGHDAATADLKTFYRRFAAVTDPRRPDPGIIGLVTDVLDTAGAAGRLAHLNVLEDYYEVQQHKVRALLDLLDLPFVLLTVHFNTQTGRIVLDGHAG